MPYDPHYPLPPEKRRPDPLAGLGWVPVPPPSARVVVEPLPEPAPVRFPKLALLKLLTSWATGSLPKPTDKKYIPMKLKPGIKTSELWVTIGSGLLSTTLAALGLVEGTYVAVGLTILGSLYTLLRSGLKARE
jgi:hypothetical protein